MCGIFLGLSWTGSVYPSEDLESLLKCRGPDSFKKHHVVRTVPFQPDGQAEGNLLDKGARGKLHLSCFSSVLSLRGSTITNQPYAEDGPNASFLCWNGEAWSIDDVPVKASDTWAVFVLLQQACRTHSEIAAAAAEVASALSRIAGPYAFAFYDDCHHRVYFGRDFLGRRSLLKKHTTDGTFVLCSVAEGSADDRWEEVEADGVYCVDLAAHERATGGSDFQVCREPYRYKEPGSDYTGPSVIPRFHLQRATSPPSAPSTLCTASPSVSCLHEILRSSLLPRVLGIQAPPSISISSLDIRPAKLAILFSGGLDCTVLARLADDLLPPDEPIDLLNVAFENPRSHRNAADPYEICPDRRTGRTTLAELERVCPDRIWHFVAIDIPYTETLAHRHQIIKLMHPHNTEMDLSIAMALYFAARGTGNISDVSTATWASYTTFARVLLSGLGADELFGGYTRHAIAFSRNGFGGLLDELESDIGRLGKRNLGRDDRIIAHWGREPRFPYLDERLVGWAVNAPVWEKCGFGESVGCEADKSQNLEPGKKVLRCLAWKLGMQGVASEKKRAIQFGARTAKMQSGKTKGTTLLS